MSKFWWGNMKKDLGVHWGKWESLGDTKSQGGLGFRDLEAFNKILLAKQVWRLVQEPNSLAGQILKFKYFHSSSILISKLGDNPSLICRSIPSSIALIQDGIYEGLVMGKQRKYGVIDGC